MTKGVTRRTPKLRERFDPTLDSGLVGLPPDWRTWTHRRLRAWLQATVQTSPSPVAYLNYRRKAEMIRLIEELADERP